MLKPRTAVVLNRIRLQCQSRIPVHFMSTLCKSLPAICHGGPGFERRLSQNACPATVLQLEATRKAQAEISKHDQTLSSESVDGVIADIDQAETVSELFDTMDENTSSLPCAITSAAVTRLYQLQKVKPKEERNTDEIFSHTAGKVFLKAIEENSKECDDTTLLSALYTLTFLPGGHLSSSAAVQRLLQEAQRRLEVMDFAELAKFTICLQFMGLRSSPAMGAVAEIVRRRLGDFTADDLPSFAVLIDAVVTLSSGRFQEELMSKAVHLLDAGHPTDLTVRKILYAMENVPKPNKALIEKCMHALQQRIDEFDTKWLYMISMFCHNLEYRNHGIKQAILKRVEELYSEGTDFDPDSVSRLFEMAIKHGASGDLVDKTETLLLEKFDEISLESFVRLCGTVSWTNYWLESLNTSLPRILSRLLCQANNRDILRISKNHMLQNADLNTVDQIYKRLMCTLVDNINPKKVPRIVTSLSFLPLSYPESHGVIFQKVYNSSHAYDIHKLSLSAKALRNIINHPYLEKRVSNRGKFLRIINTLNEKCFALLEDAKLSSDGKDERSDRWNKLPQVANHLVRNRYYSPAILDDIARTLPDHVHWMTLSQIHSVLAAYSELNYRPLNAEQFYQASISTCLDNLRLWKDPVEIVNNAYQLAMAQYFPEKLVSFIFSVDFLGKLDQVIAHSNVGLRNRVQNRLMKLNRCVQLECPEMKIPWFHEVSTYREQPQNAAILDDIEKHLTSILGGFEFLRRGVFTPYLYKLGFEVILSANNRPLVCAEYGSALNQSQHAMGDASHNIQWGVMKKQLPPGAQRVAIDYLGAKYFCSNVHHPMGYQGMKRRHLEIMGYRYITIPHFEWKSMTLSSKEDREHYLFKKIFNQE